MTAASHQQSFVVHPLLPLSAAFAAGIAVCHYSAPGLRLVLLVAAFSTLLSIGSAIWRRPRVSVISFCSAFLFLGAGFAIEQRTLASPNKLSTLLATGRIPIDNQILIAGVIDGAVEYAPDSVHFVLRVQLLSLSNETLSTNGVVAVTVPFGRYTRADYEPLRLQHGAAITIRTELQWQDRFRNSGVEGLTDFLRSKDYDAIALVDSPRLIERGSDEGTYLSWLYYWRQQLEQRIVATFSLDTAGVLNAAVVGNRYGLSRETSDRFREGGTFHVLVISGLHISFIGGVVFMFARRVTRKRFLQFVMANGFLWLYAIAVGANASVVRAAFMFSFVSFGSIVSRRASSLNALSAAGLLLLAIRPNELFDPSFQLTFLSVFAIVTFSWPVLRRLSEIGTWRPTRGTPHPPSVPQWLLTFAETLFWSERKWLREASRSSHKYKLFKTQFATTLERWHLQFIFRYAFAAFVVSASVQLTLAPLLVVHFHRISLAAFVLNIVVSALMVVLTGIGAVALLVGLVSSTLAGPFIHLANAVNWLTVNSVAPFSFVHVASVRVPEYSGPSAWIYFLYFVPLLLLSIVLARWDPFLSKGNRGNRALKPLLWFQLLLLFIVVAHPFSRHHSNHLRVDFLDVGQGDSALVTAPGGATLLIDGGGRPDFLKGTDEVAFERDTRSIGDAVVSEFLWSRGFDRIDYILATHADADHMDGLNDVAKNFAVRAALVGRMPEADREFDLLRATLIEQAVPIVPISAGDRLKFGGVSLDVLWPPGDVVNGPSRNNESVVLRIKSGARSILMTGDIESAAESSLAESGLELASDVVKVAHHGSKTSSTQAFVNAIGPRVAIISVGRKSMFGHPHAQVLERWLASGAEVLTTGRCGTITVETDGNEIQLDTFVAGCR